MKKQVWKKYRYCIRIDLMDFFTMQYSANFVTDVNKENGTFEFHTLEEAKQEEKEIKVFEIDDAMELMSRMFENGYKVSIAPCPSF